MENFRLTQCICSYQSSYIFFLNGWQVWYLVERVIRNYRSNIISWQRFKYLLSRDNSSHFRNWRLVLVPRWRVRYMILCEGDFCVVKWFHFECVGLLFSPAFSWFCPHCKWNVNEIHIRHILFSLDECTCWVVYTVEPLHNGHRRDKSFWPLWRGGRCRDCVGVIWHHILIRRRL